MAQVYIDVGLESDLQSILTSLGVAADKTTLDTIYNLLQNNSSGGSTGIVKSVQHGQVIINTPNSSSGAIGTATINEVDLDKSFLINNGSMYTLGETQTYKCWIPIIELTNSTTVTGNLLLYFDDPVYTDFCVIEFY